MQAQDLMARPCFSGRQLAVRPPSVRRARIGAVKTCALHSTDPKKRVVITGMGVCSVFGNDVDEFYDKLLAGTNGVKQITRFDASEYPTTFAAQIENFDNEGLIDKKNARRYDDCLSYTLVSAKKALRQAGIEKEANPDAHGSLDKTRVGILIGTGMGGLTVFQDNVSKLVQQGYKKITPFFIPYAITNITFALQGWCPCCHRPGVHGAQLLHLHRMCHRQLRVCGSSKPHPQR